MFQSKILSRLSHVIRDEMIKYWICASGFLFRSAAVGHHSVLCTQRPRLPGFALLETVQAFSPTCTEETKDFRRGLNQVFVALTLTLRCQMFLALFATTAAFLRALFEAQGEVNPTDDADDDGLPGNQVSEPIEQLPVQDVCLLPAGRGQRN